MRPEGMLFGDWVFVLEPALGWDVLFFLRGSHVGFQGSMTSYGVLNVQHVSLPKALLFCCDPCALYYSVTIDFCTSQLATSAYNCVS